MNDFATPRRTVLHGAWAAPVVAAATAVPAFAASPAPVPDPKAEISTSAPLILVGQTLNVFAKVTNVGTVATNGGEIRVTVVKPAEQAA